MQIATLIQANNKVELSTYNITLHQVKMFDVQYLCKMYDKVLKN